MSLANVNIGTAANDGTGDPLRSAFRTINQNFANLAPFAANGNIIYNAGVESVAGRTGNVTLTVTDVLGAASIGYVDTVAAGLSDAAVALAATLTTVTWANITSKPDFADIATSGSWNDLSDIPANVSDAVTQYDIDVANDAMIANIRAANARIGSLESSVSTLSSSAYNQGSDIDDLRANITAANTAIGNIVDHTIASINANITAANATILGLDYNYYVLQYNITTNTNRINAANAELGNLRANITSANSAILSVSNAWQSNAATQEAAISGLRANINAANSVVSTLSSAITANNIAQQSLISALTANTGGLAANINTLFSNAATQSATFDTINANIGAFQIFSNANAVTQRTQIVNLQENLNTTNACVAALITANTVQNSIIVRMDANIGNLSLLTNNNTSRIGNLEQTSTQLVNANIATEANIALLQANTRQLASNISILYANAATQLGQINLVNSNVTTQTDRVNDLYSNIVLRMTDITTLFSNAATQSTSLTTLTSNAATQSVAIASLDANVGGMASNIGTFQSNLATLYILNGSHGDEIDELYDRVGNLEVLTANTAAGLDVANTAIISAEGNLMLITDDIYANLAVKTNDTNAVNVAIGSTNTNVAIINNTLRIVDANIGVLYNLLPIGNANVAAANVAIAAVASNVTSIQTALLNSVVVTATNTRVGFGTGVGSRSVSVGWTAGQTTQGTESVAIGTGTGKTNQGSYAVAVGRSAGNVDQGNYAVAIGHEAGFTSQGVGAVAIGQFSGSQQGNNSVVIGRLAGLLAAQNSIVIDATNSSLTSIESGLYIKPIRNLNLNNKITANVSTTANVVFYNSTTGEVTYGNLAYTPNNAAHWNGTVSNVAAALDQLAARIWAIENP